MQKDVKWNIDIKPELTIEQYLQLKCDKCDPGLKKIIPAILEMNPIVIYHACKANVYSALKRDCLEVPTPESQMVKRFQNWYDEVFLKEIEPILRDFEYCYNSWYNHLDKGQQARINNIFSVRGKQRNNINLYKRHYKMFCKKEKQEVTDDVRNPKNRCICGPNEEYKYVMGPVVYRLELLFKKRLKGYCSGRSWEEREHNLNYRKYLGLLKTIQGDGSGFDRTQFNCLKYVERKVYNYLCDHDKIHHVGQDVFRHQACADTVTIQAIDNTKVLKYRQEENLGFVRKTGGVQSGNCDTSFANTLRMCMYNRFIVEEIMGLSPQEYDLDAAGDDFCVCVKPDISDDLIQSSYLQVFTKNKTGQHGLGQILKFLKIGTLEDVDFCSTECFWSETNKSYKIIRKIDRFLTLTAWSQKALSMNSKQQAQHMVDLANANKMWMQGLPILEEYNQLLYVYAKRLVDEKLILMGGSKPKNKKLLPVTPYFAKLYADSYSERFNNLKDQFGSSEAYAMLPRLSSKLNCADDFLKYLKRKYNLLEDEVKYLQRSLSKDAVETTINHDLSIPLLRKMCDHKAAVDAQLLDINQYQPYFHN